MIIAASGLEIMPLVDLLSACLALKLKKMNVEQIREYFNVTNDYTEEELDLVRKENEIAGEVYELFEKQ